MATGRISLMEVFNMVYLGRDKVVPEKQFGTITMIFEGYCQDLYKVEKGDVKEGHPSIECKDDIVSTIKAPPVNFTNLDLKFNLFDSAYTGSINICFDAECDPYQITHGKEIIKSRDGFGSISVLYGLFADGAVADVENKYDFDDANVYGFIGAFNSKLDCLDCVSMLLVKKPDNVIQIRKGSLIPLSRSRVAVPMGSKFSVIISLHAHDKVYQSTVQFNAKKKGSFHKDATFSQPMEAGTINVKVTWTTNVKSIAKLHDYQDNDDYEPYSDDDEEEDDSAAHVAVEESPLEDSEEDTEPLDSSEESEELWF